MVYCLISKKKFSLKKKRKLFYEPLKRKKKYYPYIRDMTVPMILTILPRKISNINSKPACLTRNTKAI